MRRLLIYITVAFAAVSCVYPFETDLPEGQKRLAIEGDIIIGTESEFLFSYVMPLSTSVEEMEALRPTGTVWVEDENGGRYESSSKPSSRQTVDLRLARDDVRYRAHFLVEDNQREYISEWMYPSAPPVVDTLSYSNDEDYFYVNLSFHSNDKEHYFRWTYEETWEYHTRYQGEYLLDEVQLKATPTLPDKFLTPIQPELYPYHFCWDHSQSTEVGLTATTSLTEDRVIDRNFLKMTRHDARIMSVYHMELHLRSISKECYDYLKTMDKNSDNYGSLFATIPSELRGNITCVTDETEFVIGFVDVTREVDTDMWYFESKGNLFKGFTGPESLFLPQIKKKTTYLDYYNSNYLPVKYGEIDYVNEKGETVHGEGYLWSPGTDVDCRRCGGTKNKPEGWPSPNI